MAERPSNHPAATHERTEGRTFLVVVNDEEQYSIWDEAAPVPAGWRATGFAGPEQDCLAHIDEVWTDMRPRSLRDAS
ncbi:MbtH family protein [Actinoplanes sp. NPDC049681]|uniref:MbtH family protein n=1 Tax=Actinoplanes sp. NPDC049681 TaxID=3363905 RepID=UPI00378897F3